MNADRREHRQVIYYVVRYNSAINVKDRVVENGKQLNIVNMANLYRNLYLKLETQLTQ
mgnify:FL=1